MSQIAAGGAPLYEQIKAVIARRIREDEWPADFRLPHEEVLAAEFDVSPLTVRRALRELQSQGLLVRIQGRGTFVIGPGMQCAIFDLHDLSEEIELNGGIHSCEIVALCRIDGADPRARLLSADGTVPVLHSRLVHKEDGTPIQLEDRFVNADEAPDYLLQDFTRTSPQVYLQHKTDVDSVDNTIRAIRPDAETQVLLKIDITQPCLLLDRRTWRDEVPVTRSRLTYPGDRYRLRSSHESAPRRIASPTSRQHRSTR